MGLDISAFSKIEKLNEEEDSDSCVGLYPNPDFVKVAEEIEDCDYKYERRLDFRAGSYSGYNYWREQLAELSKSCNDQDSDEEVNVKYFYELINFSDCEGVIGSKTSLKLYNDFVKCEEVAKTIDERFYSLYVNWKEGFKLASEEGCVQFH